MVISQNRASATCSTPLQLQSAEFDQTDSVPESGSRPYFEVSVEEPQKVGDAINAHTVYKVRTKVNVEIPHRRKEVADDILTELTRL
jgi:hypothetical protein